MHTSRRTLHRRLLEQPCTCPCRLPRPSTTRSIASYTAEPRNSYSRNSYYRESYPRKSEPNFEPKHTRKNEHQGFRFLHPRKVQLPHAATRSLPLSHFIEELKDWSWNGSERANAVERKISEGWKEDVESFLEKEKGWEEDVVLAVRRLNIKTVDLLVLLAERGEAGLLRVLVRTMMEGKDKERWSFDDGVLGNTRPFQSKLPQQIRLEMAKVDLVYPVKTGEEETKPDGNWERRLRWLLMAVGKMLLSEEKACWGTAKQILAYLHSIDAVPRSLYDPESHPRLYVSEQRILSLLTDAVWECRGKREAPQSAKEKSQWSLGMFFGTSKETGEIPGERELLLELLLCFCIEGGYFPAGQAIVRDIILSEKWKFGDIANLTPEEAQNLHAPLQMGSSTPPDSLQLPIELQTKVLPRNIEDALRNLSVQSLDAAAITEELATIRHKFTMEILTIADISRLRTLVSTQVIRESFSLAIELMELLDLLHPPIRSLKEFQAELFLRESVLERLISNESAISKVKRSWRLLQQYVAENSEFLHEDPQDYEHPTWLLGSLLDYFTQHDIAAADVLLSGPLGKEKPPAIRREAYIEMLPHIAEYILATGRVGLAEDLEVQIAETIRERNATPSLDWFQNLLSLWLRLGSRSRAREVLTIIHKQGKELTPKGLSGLITGAYELAHRAGTTLDNLKLFIPAPNSDDGKPIPLTAAYLTTASLPRSVWLSLFRTGFSIRDQPLIQLTAKHLSLSADSFQVADQATASTVIEILLSLEGLPSAWKFFNAHFHFRYLFHTPAPSLNAPPAPSTSTKFEPTRQLARAFLRKASLEANRLGSPKTQEELHYWGLVKDVEGWATRFMLKTGNWTEEDLRVFQKRVLREKWSEDDGEKKGASVLDGEEDAGEREVDWAPAYKTETQSEAKEEVKTEVPEMPQVDKGEEVVKEFMEKGEEKDFYDLMPKVLPKETTQQMELPPSLSTQSEPVTEATVQTASARQSSATKSESAGATPVVMPNMKDI